MELSTIIGIVIAIMFIVIALKMMFSKSADPLSDDQPIHVHPETNLPIVPRHLRVAAEQAKTSAEKIEPTLSDAALTDATPDADAQALAVQPVTDSKPEQAHDTEAVAADNLNADATAYQSVIADEVTVEKTTAENVTAVQTAAVESEAKTTAAEKTAAEQTEAEQTEANSIVAAPTKPAVAVSTDEIEDWDGESSILDLHLTEQQRHDEESALACAEHIVSFYVWPNPARALSGEKTLKILLKYGLRYGEMQCFHRYQQVDEASPLMFSVLRLTDEGPAGFDLETLSTEQVNGLAFFLALPNAHAGLGFDSMASIANHIAKEVDGKVYDENGQELTPQLRDHWRHQVIEFRSGQQLTVAG